MYDAFTWLIWKLYSPDRKGDITYIYTQNVRCMRVYLVDMVTVQVEQVHGDGDREWAHGRDQLLQFLDFISVLP